MNKVFETIESIGNRCEASVMSTFGEKYGSPIVKYGPFCLRTLAIIIYYFIGIGYYTTVEHWTQVDTAYFITATVSTVGYGYFHPTTDPSRVFTCFYAILGIFLVFEYITYLAKTFILRMQNRFLDMFSPSESVHTRAVKRIVLSIISILIAIFVGTVFFSSNEPWTVAMAFYWTITTMTTIGYGDLNIVHESSRRFSIPFILWVVSIYVTAINNIVEAYSDSYQEQTREKVISTSFNDIELIPNADDPETAAKVDRSKFILDTLLKMGIISQANDVDPILAKLDSEVRRRSLHHNSAPRHAL